MAADALDDAGYASARSTSERPLCPRRRRRGASLAMAYGFRSYLPLLDAVPGMPI